MEMKMNPDEKNAYALIVGISKYKDLRIPPLRCTTKDAWAFFEVLINPELMGLKKENIKLLVDDEATYFNIKNAISGWLYRVADEESLVIIFFAGHGGLEEDRTGIEKDNLCKYLLPYDANFENLYASALTNREFNELLISVKSKRLVVFMDSCYSGGVTEKKARDVKLVDDPYEKISSGEGRLVIAASQPNQRSFEDESLGHGIFTYHLLEALKGAADDNDNNDGYSTALEIYDYLSKSVPKSAMHYAGSTQEPILRGDLKSDIVLVVNRKKIEKIELEKIKKKNLKRLSDLYHEGMLSDEQFELAYRLLESKFEDLDNDEKKALKSLNAMLLNKISVLTFSHDVEIIKGFKGQAYVKSEFEGIQKSDSMSQTTAIRIVKTEYEEVKGGLNERVRNYCSNCGYQNPNKLRYCTNCGESLEKQTEKLGGQAVGLEEKKLEVNISNKKYCTNCGHQNIRKLKYCTKCGVNLLAE